MTDNRHILIVDDNRINIAVLGATFRDEGYVVDTATGVDEAQAFLEKAPSAVDLILSDIMMPVKSGFDLLKWLKEPGSRFSELPLLLITSQLPEPEHRVRGLSLGAVDYVLRSLDPQELVIRVGHAIDNFRQLRALRENLTSSESLAAVGRILAASNHEIKNLAMIIKATAGVAHKMVLRPGSATATQLATATEGILRTADLLADVTRTMSKFASNEKIDVVPVAWLQFLSEVLLLVQPLVKNCMIEVKDPPQGATAVLSASASHLKQVIINLFINAVDAIDEMAPVEGGLIHVSVAPGGDRYWDLCVKDNGVGLQEAGVKKDFEAFATTKQLRGGNGLGLWLCARFVKAMGGELSLASDGPGKGAQVTVRLPRGEL